MSDDVRIEAIRAAAIRARDLLRMLEIETGQTFEELGWAEHAGILRDLETALGDCE